MTAAFDRPRRACALTLAAAATMVGISANAFGQGTSRETPRASMVTREAPQDAADEPGIVTKARNALDRLHARGIYPSVDTIVSGSGLAFGGAYRSPTFGQTAISAEVGAMFSIRGYREYTGQIGRLDRKRSTVQLQAPGAEIGSMLNARAQTSRGWAAYLDARRFSYPRVEYFGLNPRADEPRADFALTGTGVDAVVQWQPRDHVGLSARLGVLDLSPGPGSNGSRPNVEDVYTAATAPGVSDEPRYRVAGIGASWDRRDPTMAIRGVYAGGTIWRYSALGDTASPSFSRFTADLRGFYPIVGERHVIAAAFLAAADRTPGSNPIPFYLQSWLGGSKTLRAFSSYRLRSESLVHGSLEYRWRANRFVEIAPLLDIGAGSATGASLSDGPLRTALGAGIRIRYDSRFYLRLDYAHGDDGHRFIFTTSPAF